MLMEKLMESALLVLRSPNHSESDFMCANIAFAREIISHLSRIVNLSLVLSGQSDEQQYSYFLNGEFEAKIRVVSPTELNKYRADPREARLIDYRPFVDWSFELFEYIRQYHYDLVIFDVFDAPGFIPIRAKRTGLGLQTTVLMSWLTNCHEFVNSQLSETPCNFDPLIIKDQLCFAEKYCCENSDLVLSHTDTILRWVSERQWKIDPARVVRMDDLKVSCPISGPSSLQIQHDRMWDQEPLGLKDSPLVSICVAHYNDGRNLSYLLKSIEQNDYNNFEVIVVDDGSTDIESLKILESLTSEYVSDSWQFIMKEENEGPGPTRNLAVSLARAEFVIFMDSDNLAAKTMISDFVNGILTSGVDCLTCSMVQFRGDGPVPEEADLVERWMPLGGSIALGFYHNFLGDTNFCVKKSVFEALGGFSDILDFLEDWDFLARLVLAGFEMDVIPKGIYFYRLRSGSRFQSDWSRNSIQALRKRLLFSAGHRHEKLVHSILIKAIAENERLRASVWKLDRKIVKTVLKLAAIVSEKHRLILENMTANIYTKLKVGISNSRRLIQYLNPRVGKEYIADDGQNFTTEGKIDSSRFFVRIITDSEHEEQLRRFGLPSSRPIFGFVSELDERSRPLGFLRLAYWMQMFKDNGFFVITGDGPLRDDVLAIAAKYKLSNFKWIPLLERPEQLYAVLSGLVITGAFAQQGSTVMLQALACGVPVFSTDVAESRRVLGLYGSGLVVKHDPERKDFADCFKLWKDNLDIYKTAAMETADLIRKH